MNAKLHKISLTLNLYKTHILSKCIQEGKLKFYSKTDSKIGVSGGSEVNSENYCLSYTNLANTLRKWTRQCTKDPLHSISNFISVKIVPQLTKNFLSLNTIFIPKNLFEALTSEEQKNVNNVEIQILEKNQTWEVVDLRKQKRVRECRYLFAIKCKYDETIEKFKARLVVKGYTQTYGIDYQQTFALAQMNTVCALLSLVTNFHLQLQQLDVKNVFQYGELKSKFIQKFFQQERKIKYVSSKRYSMD